MLIRPFRILNVLTSIIILLSISTFVYTKTVPFHSPYFDLSLTENLKLISKTEQENDGFYRYVFASSNSADAELQMRVIVSRKGSEKGKSLEEFQTSAVANMSAMFMDSYGLYQYLNTPKNKKVLGEKPGTLKFGDTTFSGITMYFGTMDASFWVTNSHDMTYAFTLISKNTNEQTRESNLERLTQQLRTIKFNSSIMNNNNSIKSLPLIKKVN